MSEAASQEEKGESWFTAFYRFAQYVSALTDGAVNNKQLYALVGSLGKFVNSENSVVRRRTAGHLSRLMHSTRYAADLRERLEGDPQCFEVAAQELRKLVLKAGLVSAEELLDSLLTHGWSEIRAGLAAEQLDGRFEINLNRLDNEFDLMRGWAAEERNRDLRASTLCVLESYFSMMAWGHLKESFTNMLVDECPTDMLPETSEPVHEISMRACVMRAVESDPSSIENMWALGADGSFEIGRYMDCDAIETNGLVSRRHCRIYRQDAGWFVQDLDSRFGTCVLRDGKEVWRSDNSNSDQEFLLQFGDDVVLAGCVHYWFVSLQNIERLLVG